ncbi:MAG: GNAT family N-acetyltransferase [Candidatus Eremiobacteraeota bacterium]|nr:GNAT family N-acetyltransferase [Candidatus Eremiobacteraeota bacterium]
MRSGTSFRVRAVAATDVEAWAAMRFDLWPEFDAAQMRQEAAEHVARASSLIAVAYIAEDEDAAPLGFIELSLRPFSDGCESMPVPHVEGWYVDKHTRGRGVGRALMNAAEAWCREQGFTELASDTELANGSSRRAHEALGFGEVDRLVKFRKLLVVEVDDRR